MKCVLDHANSGFSQKRASFAGSFAVKLLVGVIFVGEFFRQTCMSQLPKAGRDPPDKWQACIFQLPFWALVRRHVWVKSASSGRSLGTFDCPSGLFSVLGCLGTKSFGAYAYWATE